MTEAIPLHPDESPHCARFREEINAVVREHTDRGQMTRAEIVGVLEVVKIEVVMAATNGD